MWQKLQFVSAPYDSGYILFLQTQCRVFGPATLSTHKLRMASGSHQASRDRPISRGDSRDLLRQEVKFPCQGRLRGRDRYYNLPLGFPCHEFYLPSRQQKNTGDLVYVTVFCSCSTPLPHSACAWFGY